MDTFVGNMQIAPEYLEQREFEEFVDECVVTSDSSDANASMKQQQIAVLAIFRGRLILALDQVLPRAATQQSVWAEQVKASRLVLNHRGTDSEFHAQCSKGYRKITKR
ncbi:hypothetical protein [Allorhodopirellula solitaria]|uniref:Uncharacterized protein n=1 Tax=Allorhodopirellula solitaria TaxID=2527987 RepID=A0A5C5WYM0_9BACT|nr:hypothetical protein [Allorhodopirellula solitaria]TWT55369.1 hypothetical protein CA85_49420 [Allorhodopirellula solitaria]